MKSTPGSEVVRGEERIPERRVKPWSALKYRDFRFLASGQLVSQLGTWMQFTSLTYLLGVVIPKTAQQSSLDLAFLGAAQSIPAILCSPIAGYVADTFPRRRTLLLVGIGRALLALALAVVAPRAGDAVVPIALILAATFAGVVSFDFPTRNSWIGVLVPPQVLPNAIGLIAIANNAPLMVGPAIAGILIATVGVYTSFYVQAIGQCLVILLIVSMRPAPPTTKSREPMMKQIVEGLRFVGTHPVLRWVVLLLLMFSVFVRPYNFLLAAFAGHVLHVAAGDYGMMLAVGGIGTLIGAFTTATIQTEHRGKIFLAAGALGAVTLIILSFVRSYTTVLVLLTFLGFGTMMFTNTSNYLIQWIAPQEVRGRALSLLSMIVLGGVPAGALLIGSLASLIGLTNAYLIGGIVGIICVVFIAFAKPAVREA